MLRLRASDVTTPGLLACLSKTRIGLFDFSEPTHTGLVGAGTDLVTSGLAPWVWNGAAILAAMALFVVFRGLDRPDHALVQMSDQM